MARPKKYTEERVTTAVRLPVSLHRRLQEEAEARDVSVNYLVTKAATRMIDSMDATGEPEPEPEPEPEGGLRAS